MKRYCLLLLLSLLRAFAVPAQDTGTIHVKKQENTFPFSGLFHSDSYTLRIIGKGMDLGETAPMHDYFYFFRDSNAVRVIQKFHGSDKQARKKLLAVPLTWEVREAFYDITGDSVHVYLRVNAGYDDDSSIIWLRENIYTGVIKDRQPFLITSGWFNPLFFKPCRRAKNKLLEAAEK